MKKLIIFIIVFSVISFSCVKQKKHAEAEENLARIAAGINKSLTKLRLDIEELTSELNYKIPYHEEFNSDFWKNYSFDKENNLIANKSSNKSAIYLSNKVTLNDSLMRFIINSESYVDLFKSVLEQNILLAQIYFQKSNSFLRIYPYIEVSNYTSSDFNVLKTITYQTVKNKPHIKNRAYWIDKPFADPYGRGWILSCSEPIYYRDNYIGIVSGDISINELRLNYFSSNSDIVILVNRNFQLIAATRDGEKFLNIPAYRDYQYYKPIIDNAYLYTHSYVTEHESDGFKKAINEIRLGKKESSFYLNNKKHILISEQIQETGWYVLQIIN